MMLSTPRLPKQTLPLARRAPRAGVPAASDESWLDRGERICSGPPPRRPIFASASKWQCTSPPA